VHAAPRAAVDQALPAAGSFAPAAEHRRGGDRTGGGAGRTRGGACRSGGPIQITHDDADHEQARWSPDSSSLIYFSPPETSAEQGTIWQISALGGTSRRVAEALTGGDWSHDGRRIAFFHAAGRQIELAAVGGDGTGITRLKELPNGFLYFRPRWSPDDNSVAFERRVFLGFDRRILIVSAHGGETREVAHGRDMRGFAWFPDGSGLVYSSALGSSVLYPPIFNLRQVGRNGTGDRQTHVR